MFGMSIKNEFFRMVLEQKGINKLCGLPLVVVGRMLNELSCFNLILPEIILWKRIRFDFKRLCDRDSSLNRSRSSL
ncbi:unnamed protein product [Meloidogyne enterolobii]|uniref:Uncharacterized protein n=1 Tax=Meloidogyne enterolobii TaxID=390850 RepID=A0ACB0Y2B9_MELEN